MKLLGLLLAVFISFGCGCFFGFMVYQPLLTMADVRGSGMMESFVEVNYDATSGMLLAELRISVYLHNKSNLPGQLLVESPTSLGFPILFTLPQCREWNDDNAITHLNLNLELSEVPGVKIKPNSLVELRFTGSYYRNGNFWRRLTEMDEVTYDDAQQDDDDLPADPLCGLPQSSMSGITLMQLLFKLKQECETAHSLLMEMNFGTAHLYTLAGYAGGVQHRTYPFFVPCTTP